MKKVVVELTLEDLQEMSDILHEMMRNEISEMRDKLLKYLEQQQTGAAVAIGIMLDIAMAKPVKSEVVKKTPRFVWRTVLSLIATDKKMGTHFFDWITSVTAFEDGSLNVLAVSPDGEVIKKEWPAQVKKGTSAEIN